MNRVDTTKTGGQPFVLDDVRFNDDAYRDAFNSLLRSYGDSFIVYGCQVNGNAVSAGFVMRNRELLKVEAHARTGDYYQKSTTYDPNGHKTFKNGQVYDVYEKNRAVCSAGGGTLAYNGVRIGFGYTKAEVDQKLADLVNSSPTTLDTLKELADALGDDPNFATTITNLIGQKAAANSVFTKAESDARYYNYGTSQLTELGGGTLGLTQNTTANAGVTYHELHSLNNHYSIVLNYTLNQDAKLAFLKIWGTNQGHFTCNVYSHTGKLLYGSIDLGNDVPLQLKLEKVNEIDNWILTTNAWL